MRLTVDKLTKVLAKGNTLNTFISDRAGRKSSVVQEYMINEALNGNPFILLRSKKDENISEHWLSQYVKELATSRGLIFWSENINSNVTAIYFKYKNSDEHFLYCYGLWLSLDKKYKSNYFDGFEKVKYIVWEECIPTEPLNQTIKFVQIKAMQEIKRVLSIGSTITRGRPDMQYIFLGNDISDNIINPITVTFDILERLSANCEIEDICYIDDKKYTFYFMYFDFDGAINHWLNNNNFDINNNIDVTPFERYPFIIVTNFKRYYMYNCKTFLYITETKSEHITHSIKNAYEFFKLYDAVHLYNNYPLNTALILLITFYNASSIEIEQYFGYDYMQNPKFIEHKQAISNNIINISELANMKLNKLMTCDNYSDILAFNQLLKNNPVMYSNIKLKIDCDNLKLALMLVD